MQIPVVIERVAENSCRAKVGEPVPCSAEGATPDEALQKLRELVADRMANIIRVVPLELVPAKHPWAPFGGTLRDEPLCDAWQQAMADYRRQMDEDPDVLGACSSLTRTS
jgi:hypothetical protein